MTYSATLDTTQKLIEENPRAGRKTGVRRYGQGLGRLLEDRAPGQRD